MADSTKKQTEDIWTASPLSDEIFDRINGCSFRKNPHIGREDLRYLKVLHTGFDGRCDAIYFTTEKDVLPPSEVE